MALPKKMWTSEAEKKVNNFVFTDHSAKLKMKRRKGRPNLVYFIILVTSDMLLSNLIVNLGLNMGSFEAFRSNCTCMSWIMNKKSSFDPSSLCALTFLKKYKTRRGGLVIWECSNSQQCKHKP